MSLAVGSAAARSFEAAEAGATDGDDDDLKKLDADFAPRRGLEDVDQANVPIVCDPVVASSWAQCLSLAAQHRQLLIRGLPATCNNQCVMHAGSSCASS